MKRIAVILMDNDMKNLNWIMDSIGCNQSEAVRLALSLVGETISEKTLLEHYLNLRKQDRARRLED